VKNQYFTDKQNHAYNYNERTAMQLIC